LRHNILRELFLLRSQGPFLLNPSGRVEVLPEYTVGFSGYLPLPGLQFPHFVYGILGSLLQAIFTGAVEQAPSLFHLLQCVLGRSKCCLRVAGC
jgi:hypothetical protein